MNQYIITEEELLDTRSYIYHEDEVAFSRIESKVRSHPYQSERDKVLNGDWVRDKFFEWVNSRERPPSIYACGKKWEELRQSKQDGE